METMDKLAGYIGVKSATARNMTDDEQTAAADEANAAVEAAEKALAGAQKAAEKGLLGKSLTLRTGDTAEDFNQLRWTSRICTLSPWARSTTRTAT